MTEKGKMLDITFRMPTEEDLEQIKVFLTKYYFDEEPVFKGLNLWKCESFMDRIFVKCLEKNVFGEFVNGLKNRVAGQFNPKKFIPRQFVLIQFIPKKFIPSDSLSPETVYPQTSLSPRQFIPSDSLSPK